MTLRDGRSANSAPFCTPPTGGRTWQEQKNVLNLPKFTRQDLSEEDEIKQRIPQLYLEDLFLVAVSFQNPREGYIAGETGILLKTDNGGETWTRVPLNGFNTLLSITTAGTDQNTGVATGVLGTLATSSDGQWQVLPDIR